MAGTMLFGFNPFLNMVIVSMVEPNIENTLVRDITKNGNAKINSMGISCSIEMSSIRITENIAIRKQTKTTNNKVILHFGSWFFYYNIRLTNHELTRAQ